MEQTQSANVRYVIEPSLVRKDRPGGGFSLYHPGHGTSLDVEPESSALVEAVLAGFVRPTTLQGFLATVPELPEELFVLMLRSCFIVEQHEQAFLQHGFLRPTPVPLGAQWAWSDLPELAAPGCWVVLGAPVDMAAAGAGGARHGPSEIRKVVNGPLLSAEGDVIDPEFQRLYRDLTLSVADLGDLDPDGARMDHVGQRLRKVVRELFALGMRPLLLGGDHSLTHYVLSEALDHVPRFGIIHFDAHHDLGPSSTVSHANVFQQAISSPQVVSITQIGLRVIERVSPYATRVPCKKRRLFSARETKAGLALRGLEALPRDIPYYLSFDIDCIDGALARETGTPAFGGLSYDLASELVDYVARTFDLLGADFVEVSGPTTAPNAAALIAASLLQRVLMGQSEFEPLSSDVYTFDP